jgi:hypothetical protein
MCIIPLNGVEDGAVMKESIDSCQGCCAFALELIPSRKTINNHPVFFMWLKIIILFSTGHAGRFLFNQANPKNKIPNPPLGGYICYSRIS